MTFYWKQIKMAAKRQNLANELDPESTEVYNLVYLLAWYLRSSLFLCWKIKQIQHRRSIIK